MATQTGTQKKDTRIDVYDIVTGKIIEHLQKASSRDSSTAAKCKKDILLAIQGLLSSSAYSLIFAPAYALRFSR